MGKRLTYKEPNGKWGIVGMHEDNMDQKLYGVCAKLRDYEDTGLSPSEVQRMIDSYEEAKRELIAMLAKETLEMSDIGVGIDMALEVLSRMEKEWKK